MTDGLPLHHKGHDADKTMLAASAVPNTFAHMEADFGSLIWSAFGSRFLSDLGYGSQAKDIYATEKNAAGSLYTMIDNGPIGHTTVYVPEATYIHDYTGLTMNSSHVKGGIGTASEGVWGDASGVHLDGAYVYGKVDGNPAYAEAEARVAGHFDRWLIQLPGGHSWWQTALKRADRSDVTPAETWTFAHQEGNDPAAPANTTAYTWMYPFWTRTPSDRTGLLHVVLQPGYHRRGEDSRRLGNTRALQPVVYDNYKNNGGVVTHKLLRYEPSEPAAHDARCLPCSRPPRTARGGIEQGGLYRTTGFLFG